VTPRVGAGRSRGLAGGWLRLCGAPQRLMVPTVAHLLYDRAGRLHPRVLLDGERVRVHAVVPLPELQRASADAALLEPDPAWCEGRLEPAPGHLNQFVPGLRVACALADGGIARGRLVRDNWAGRMAYRFGTRWVTGQWIVAVDRPPQDAAGRLVHAGDSGGAWRTDDGVLVGLQAGIPSAHPYEAIVTPLETCCKLFGVRAAR
jgi:hypothetical protein